MTIDYDMKKCVYFEKRKVFVGKSENNKQLMCLENEMDVELFFVCFNDRMIK